MPLTIPGGSGGESIESYVRIVHQEPPNTGGGATVAGAWETRPLNTITNDAAGLASLAGSVITLAPGSYRMRIQSETFGIRRMKTRLNDTTNALIYLGTNAWPPAGQQRPSWITGKFTLAAPANFIVEQWGLFANPIYGWGKDVPNTGSNMIYCVAEFFHAD